MPPERGDRKLTVIILTFMAFAWTTALSSEVKCAESAVGYISYDDIWHYSGEVERVPFSEPTCRKASLCAQYCSGGYCAHGNGSLGTDGDWNYEGTFVHGRLEGYGTLDEDTFVYFGGFRHGMFDGLGVLTYDSGTRYEGTFVCGWMVGVFKVARSIEGVTTDMVFETTEMFSNKTVASRAPC